MSKYLVTGGAGFIGSHLVEELLRRGESVRVLDDFSTGLRENLPLHPACELLEGTLVDRTTVERAVSGCEFVLHQGAIPSVPRSVNDPLTSHHTNVDGTVNLLVAARGASVRRLVFAGSSSVYGDTAVLPKREDMTPNPLSPYALQKLMAERYCQLFTRLYQLETVTTRYFNVFGPRQRPGSPYSGVISVFANALACGEAPTIHGDGKQTRDFTYVTDVVDGVLRACTASNIAGEVVNVAAGRRISLLHLYATLQQLLNRTTIKPVIGPPRTGDVRDSEADITKARQLLGFEPRVSFEDGLAATIAWHMAMPQVIR
jgi:nucleoside-diphosphate-sugar epimerase